MNEQRPPQGTPLPTSRPAITPQPAGPAKIPVIPTLKPKDGDLEPLSLVDEPAGAPNAAPTPSKIKAFGTGIGGTASQHAWKRQPNATGHGAIRVRTFHGRLSDEGMVFLDEKINEWIDSHPEIEVKFVSTTIGTFEGKIREPALVVNVWY